MVDYSKYIKQKAQEYGFLSCGISQAGFLEKEAPILEQWLNENHEGEMEYMKHYFDIRLNPKLLLDGAESVLSLSYNYFPEKTQNPGSYKISKYAYGKDYHKVVKNKLKKFLEDLQNEIGAFNARVFVDSAPILEKSWAQKSGLGWMGKNANIITPKVGSFFFLAEIICDVQLTYDSPINDFCGSCTQCIDACPTQAIEKPYVVNGSKCISYATIELKNNIPDFFNLKMEDWIFGCDICQDVCPWNRFSTPTLEEKFNPKSEILHYSTKDWEEITEEVFNYLFEGSAVKRTKYQGFMRNIQFIKKSKE